VTDYTKAISSVFIRHGVPAQVVGHTRGPSITRYEVTVGNGVKMSRIASLQAEIAYATASESVRVLAPIPGKAAVGIELPNDERDVVCQDDIAVVDAHPLTVGIGKDIEGNVVSANLAQLPHLLIGGATNSGKSSCINSILVSLLKADHEQVKLLLIDPKMVELTPYDGVPHLLQPVITETEEAVEALQRLVDEMERRYRVMLAAGQRTIDGLGLPYIVVVIDELADLMMQAKIVEGPIARIAQKARAAGIHLILATQRPTANVVTGLIKANVPSRLSFAVAASLDSRVILDENGAEQLLGKGDGLFKPAGERDCTRIQGALVTDQDVTEAVDAAMASDTPTEVFEPVQADVEPLMTINMAGYAEILAYLETRAEKAAQRAKAHLGKLVGRDDTALELDEAEEALAEIAGLLRALKEEVRVAA
jgi:S-DNA-T family DNA segregation ATPase FtsK/SpoIIIE